MHLLQWRLTREVFGYRLENILIAGESAGGGLRLATLLALKNRNLQLPVTAVAISLWTDLTCSSDTSWSLIRWKVSQN